MSVHTDELAKGLRWWRELALQRGDALERMRPLIAEVDWAVGMGLLCLPDTLAELLDEAGVS